MIEYDIAISLLIVCVCALLVLAYMQNMVIRKAGVLIKSYEDMIDILKAEAIYLKSANRFLENEFAMLNEVKKIRTHKGKGANIK